MHTHPKDLYRLPPPKCFLYGGEKSLDKVIMKKLAPVVARSSVVINLTEGNFRFYCALSYIVNKK